MWSFKGPKGDRGETGALGETGLNGEAGLQGPPGLPVSFFDGISRSNLIDFNAGTSGT